MVEVRARRVGKPSAGYLCQVTTPGDESRTELAWREIVEHYGERVVLPDDEAPPAAAAPRTARGHGPVEGPAPEPQSEDLADDLVDDDEVSVREDRIAEAERFRPPPPPPLPRPRTWQRGVAWAGIFVAPVIALVLALLSIYVAPLVGWALVAWFVGGFAYLVHEMPRGRDPWDDGSRV